MTVTVKGQLEIDTRRGVVYFHAEDTGWTMLRICQLDPVGLTVLTDRKGHGQLDITHMHGADYVHASAED